MSVYDVVDLTKVYPQQTRPANDRLTFQIEAGEIFGLLGDNGAGKTTLVKQLANLLAPTRGTIRLFGKPLNHSPLFTPSKIGYMPQSGFALNNLTVSEALYFTAHLRGLSRQDAWAERDRLIEHWDLGPSRNRVAARLSGGQKRLLLLATTMAALPPVLILDEPTNDLDPQHRVLVWDSLRAINAEHGTTIILVTHNVVEAERVIERVGIMRAGQLIAVGRPAALKAGLNQQLRVEVTFEPDCPPALPDGITPRLLASGRWQLLIDRATASQYLDTLAHNPAVGDFHLSTATLEDLYLSMTKEVSAIPHE
jgi:ABC-type multidrug transport system ATPase subunit